MVYTRKAVPFLFAAAVAVWVVCCYNPFLLWFQNDDFSHILLSKQGVLFQKNSFRPVCDLSIMFDYWLWGTNPVGYHFTNLVLHIVCSVLVFLFAKRIFLLHYPQACRPFTCLMCGLLFFAYPLHSEGVFWVLGRSAVLATMFSLLFLLIVLNKVQTLFNTVLYLFVYIIALLTYESAWILPVLAFILTKRQAAASFSTKIKPYYSLVAVFAIYLSAKFMATHELIGVYEGVNFLQFNIPMLAANFLRLVVMSFTAYKETPAALSACFFVLLGMVIFAAAHRFNALAPRLLLCFVVSLLPFLSLGIDTHGMEGERFLYFPSVFGVLWGAKLISQQQKLFGRYAVTGFALVVFAIQLTVNAGSYRFAGSVVKQTVAQLAKAPASKNIVIEGLPKSQHGALIFAAGLQDALGLYKPGKVPAIKILSWRYELNPLKMPYTVKIDSSARNLAVTKYVFTDNALVVYQ